MPDSLPLDLGSAPYAGVRPGRGDASSATGTPNVRRLLLALAAACVASGLTLAAVLVLADARDTERVIEHRALAAARNGAHAAEREVAAALARLEGLATSPVLRDRDLRGMHEQMLAARVPPGTWLVLFDRERQLVNTLRPFGSSLPRLADYDAATQAEWAAFLRGGEPQLSNLNPAPVAGGRAVSVLLPIKEEGRVVHVLNTILNTDRLAAVLAAQSLPPGWRGALIDRRGTVAARSGDAGLAVGGPAPEAVLAEIGARAALDGVFSGPGLVGEPALIAFARVGDTGWIAAAEVPSAVARAPTRRALLLLVGAGLALLLGGGGLAVLLARRIERPFVQVSGLLAGGPPRERAAEDRHRTHWEHTGEGLFAVRVTPDGRFVLDGLNPAHEELTGLRSADVVGREMGEFLPPDAAAAVAANYRRCVEAGAPIRY